MPVAVLNVAEKPSVAREVSRILSGGAQPHSEQHPKCASCRAGAAAHDAARCSALVCGPKTFCLTLRRRAPRHCHASAPLNHVWTFGCMIQNTPCDMRFTSSTGAPASVRRHATRRARLLHSS